MAVEETHTRGTGGKARHERGWTTRVVTAPQPDAPALGTSAETEPRVLPREAVDPTRLTHEPALDGLRGLAVGAVILYHGVIADRIDWLEPVTRGGYLGVSAFFTLSGFLICSLLLRERRRTGTVSLSAFWQRRARRLLPAAYAVILAVVVLTPLVGTQSQLDGLPGDAWSALLYVANWHFVLQGADYARQFAGAPSPLTHLWSLSVEEQWYLVVPLIALAVAVVARRRRPQDPRRTLGRAMALAVVGGTAWMVWVSGGEWSNRAYLGTDTRMAEMAVGALAAVALAGGFELPERLARPLRRAAPVVLGGLLAAWMVTPLEWPGLYRGGLTVHALAVAAVVVAAVQPVGAARRILSLPALCALGRVSYGAYLIHWPVLWWLTPERVGWAPLPTLGLQIVTTLALATVSFRHLERPIRHGGALKGRRALLAPLAALAVIALAVARLPEPDRHQILALGTAPELVVPTTTTAPATAASEPGAAGTAAAPSTTAPLPPLRIMVVGDSFAESVVTGLQRWALISGRAAVMNQTIVGCPFGRGGRNKGINVNREAPPLCDQRDERLLQALSEFRPEVVMLAGGLWDVTDRRPPGFGHWTHVGDPDYDAFLAGEMEHLVTMLGAGGAKVVWANSPHWNPVPGSVVFMGPPPYSEADFSRVDRFNQLVDQTALAHPEVKVLDLAGWMRAQPGGELDRTLRFDGVHFTDASTNDLARWLGPELLAAVGRTP